MRFRDRRPVRRGGWKSFFAWTRFSARDLQLYAAALPGSNLSVRARSFAADRPLGAQALDLRGRKTPGGKHLVGVRAGAPGRALDLPRRAAEAGRRSRLHDPVDGHEGLPRRQVRVAGSLGQRKYWRHAGIAAVEDPAPLVAGVAAE